MAEATSSKKDAVQGSDMETLLQQMSALELLRVRDWVANQEKQAASALAAEQDTSASSSKDVEQLTNSICQLREELVNVSSVASLKQMILQNAQLGQAMLHSLFPPTSEDGSGDTTPDKKMVQLAEKQATLSSAILGHHQKAQAMQPELVKLKRERRELMVTSRELVSQIKQYQSQHKQKDSECLSDAKVKNTQEKLDSEVSKLQVLRGILQGLVVGSGVNWAADPELRELVLSLDKPVKELMDD